jgi:hypothetical protein
LTLGVRHFQVQTRHPLPGFFLHSGSLPFIWYWEFIYYTRYWGVNQKNDQWISAERMAG